MACGIGRERDHDRKRVTETAEVIAHGEHVFLAGQSSEVAMQDQQQGPTAMFAESPEVAVRIAEVDVGERVAQLHVVQRRETVRRVATPLREDVGV